MEQLKKTSFDKNFYYSNFAMAKIGIGDITIFFWIMLFVSFYTLVLGENIYLILLTLGFIILLFFIFLALRLCLSKKKRKKVVLGFNKEGLYCKECGFIEWEKIKDIVIGYDFGHRAKRKGLFIVPHAMDEMVKNMPFFKRVTFKISSMLSDYSVTEAVPAIFEFYVEEPLEDIVNEIGVYISSLS